MAYTRPAPSPCKVLQPLQLRAHTNLELFYLRDDGPPDFGVGVLHVLVDGALLRYDVVGDELLDPLVHVVSTRRQRTHRRRHAACQQRTPHVTLVAQPGIHCSRSGEPAAGALSTIA